MNNNSSNNFSSDKLGDSEFQKCKKILTELKKSKKCGPFLKPVNTKSIFKI